jgi:hypothetical protein
VRRGDATPSTRTDLEAFPPERLEEACGMALAVLAG